MDWEGRRFTIRVLIVCCGQAHWDGKLNLSYIRVKPLDWGGRRFTIRVLIICYGYGQAHWDGKLNLSRSSTLFQIGYNAHGCPHQRILEERKTFTIRALIIFYGYGQAYRRTGMENLTCLEVAPYFKLNTIHMVVQNQLF